MTETRQHEPATRAHDHDHDHGVGDIVGGSAFDHGARSRFNAWFFRFFDRYINHISRRHKQNAFGDVSGPKVLELGAGVGANLDYLPDGVHLYALEPNLRMHDALRRRCDEAGVGVTLLGTGAEQIPLPDESVDDVVMSLVLCTVADPEAVLSEVRRVLRPGGTFRFVEHVVAPKGFVRRTIQRVIRRPWAWVFEGCNPGPHTPELLHRAGFDSIAIEHRRLRRSVFFPVNTAIWGVAA